MEHAEPELERKARRARRALLTFRVVFYSGVVLVGVPVLIGPRDAPVQTWLAGTTSQGRDFELRIDAGGQPDRLHTDLEATCSDSRPSLTEWRPSGPFRLDDGTLAIRETRTHTYKGYTWHRTLSLRARVTDDSVRGTMKYVDRLDDREYGPYACESGPVSFSAAAD